MIAAGLRPLRDGDAEAVLELMQVTFADLDRRMGRTPLPVYPDPGPGLLRLRHVIRTDPGGAWAAVDGGRVVGAALALVREGIWGLSLLVVHPRAQSQGLGRALLDAALAHGDGARGGIILATADPRALRAYFRAGFEMRPVMDAVGPVVRRPGRPAVVREGRWPGDRHHVDAASRAVRTAAHGPDIDALLAGGARLLVHERDGFAIVRGADVKLLAARAREAAADLLRAALADVPDGEEAHVEFLAAGQDWATAVALDAGLRLEPGGAIFVRGEVGPMAPYLPSGAYL